jgi:hypothetical protein
MRGALTEEPHTVRGVRRRRDHLAMSHVAQCVRSKDR